MGRNQRLNGAVSQLSAWRLDTKMRRTALIVGIDEYRDPEISNLICATRDAISIYSFFKDGVSYDDVRHLINPDADKILDEADTLTENLQPGDQFLFYFAGHGVDSNGRHFLLGSHAKRSRIGHNIGTVPVDLLKSTTDRPGLTRVFILDACRSNLTPGRAVDEGFRGAQGSRDIVTSPLGSTGAGTLTILCSCDEGRQAKEIQDISQGLFTAALMNTLREAQANEEPGILSDGFMRSLRRHITDLANRHSLSADQNPWLQLSGEPPTLCESRRSQTKPTLPIEALRKAEQAGDLEQAETLAREILAQDPINFEANLLLENIRDRQALSAKQDNDGRRAQYEQHLRRASEALRQGNYDAATTAVNAAADLFPDGGAINTLRSEIDNRRKIAAEAKEEAPAAITTDQRAELLKATFLKAANQRAQGDLIGAIGSYNRALKIYPGNARALKEKTEVYEAYVDDCLSREAFFQALGFLDDVGFEDLGMKNQESLETRYGGALMGYAQQFIQQRLEAERSELDRNVRRKRKSAQHLNSLEEQYDELGMDEEASTVREKANALDSEIKSLTRQLKETCILIESSKQLTGVLEEPRVEAPILQAAMERLTADDPYLAQARCVFKAAKQLCRIKSEDSAVLAKAADSLTTMIAGLTESFPKDWISGQLIQLRAKERKARQREDRIANKELEQRNAGRRAQQQAEESAQQRIRAQQEAERKAHEAAEAKRQEALRAKNSSVRSTFIISSIVALVSHPFCGLIFGVIELFESGFHSGLLLSTRFFDISYLSWLNRGFVAGFVITVVQIPELLT